jgi:hypothetical protein
MYVYLKIVVALKTVAATRLFVIETVHGLQISAESDIGLVPLPPPLLSLVFDPCPYVHSSIQQTFKLACSDEFVWFSASAEELTATVLLRT